MCLLNQLPLQIRTYNPAYAPKSHLAYPPQRGVRRATRIPRKELHDALVTAGPEEDKLIAGRGVSEVNQRYLVILAVESDTRQIPQLERVI